MRRRLAIVLNCTAHDNRAARQRIRLGEQLAEAGLDADLLCAEDGCSVGALAQQAAAGGYDVVVAGGGDGTVSAVAAAVAGTDVALGVLPFGTINHFAKSMGIPRSVEAAVQTLAGGREARIDIGEVNGHLFVNNSTFGLHPGIVQYRDDLRRRLGMNKWVAYAVATAARVRRRDFPEVRLTSGEREIRLRTPFVFVGNNDYLLGALDLGGLILPGPGELGVGLTRPEGPLAIPRLLGAAALGRLDRARGFEQFCTRELRVDADSSSFLVALDGEVLELAPPLHYRSRPRALRVITPSGRPAEAIKAAGPARRRETTAAVGG